MGVLIKDMNMPTSCPCELIGIGYDLCCSFVGGVPARVKEYYECCQNNTRPSWCPLVPVPPHGRLIDADAIDWVEGRDEQDRPVYLLLKMQIDDIPTIIEAEPYKEKGE